MKVADVPLPEPGTSEVRVRVQASPINPSDLMFARNLYGIRPQLPSSLGFEGMGIVDALGAGVQMQTGARKLHRNRYPGIWPEYVIVPRRSLIPVPAALPDDLAAQLFVNPFTASRAGAGNGA